MTSPASPTESPACCPLCGAGNACAIAAGLDAETCWCMHTAISPEALARLPPEPRNPRCICTACAQGQTPAAPV